MSHRYKKGIKGKVTPMNSKRDSSKAMIPPKEDIEERRDGFHRREKASAEIIPSTQHDGNLPKEAFLSKE